MKMTFEAVFKQIKELFLELSAGKLQEHLAYQVNLTGEPEGIFYVEVNYGGIRVEPYEYHDRDAVLICSGEALMEVLSGKEEFGTAVRLGKIRVEGSMDQALKLKKLMKND